jgi:hypothetical protein
LPSGHELKFSVDDAEQLVLAVAGAEPVAPDVAATIGQHRQPSGRAPGYGYQTIDTS